MEVVAIAATAVSAFGQIQAGKAQQAMYESQAVWNNIQAENDAIAYEQQGVNALKKTLKTMATITARAAAGNLNPFAGSIGNLQDQVLNEGYTDFNIHRISDDTRRKTGAFQSNIYKAAGKSAAQQGVFGAIGTVGGAALTYGAIGGKSSFAGATGSPGGNPTYTLPKGPMFGGPTGWRG